MGMIDRFGRIADTYVQEKSSLLESEQERRRVHMGHAFWPTEVLRDSIIFASMLMILCFYCWLIPPHYTALPTHLHKLGSFSQIGTFYSPTVICDGRIPTSIRHSSRTYWRIPRFTCNLMERSMVGCCTNWNPSRYSSTTPFPTWP